MSGQLNGEMLQILQHSIGVDQYGKGERYRNYFVAGGKDLPVCLNAVKLGLMVEREGVADAFGGNRCFHVTEEGFAYVDSNSRTSL